MTKAEQITKLATCINNKVDVGEFNGTDYIPEAFEQMTIESILSGICTATPDTISGFPVEDLVLRLLTDLVCGKSDNPQTVAAVNALASVYRKAT